MNLIVRNEAGDKLVRAMMRFVRNPLGVVERSHFMAMDRDLSGSVPTAATDGKALLLNVEWMEQWSDDEMQGVLAHEARHRMLGHPLRAAPLINRALSIKPGLSRKGAMDIYNVACDLRINYDLIQDGWRLPRSGVFDRDGEYEGMSAETIFWKLLENSDEQAAPSWGTFTESEAGDAERADALTEVERMTRTAALIAQRQGKLPGSLSHLVNVQIKPLDWDKQLAQALSTSMGSDEYSMARISRAGRRMGMVMPGTIGKHCEHLVVALDVSGSIKDRDLSHYLGIAIQICRAENPERLTIIQCDSRVQSVMDLDSHQEPPPVLKIKGRGGTSFVPVFEYVDSRNMNPEAIIYFTDMEGAFPRPSRHRTFWLSTGQIIGPFGTTIKITRN